MTKQDENISTELKEEEIKLAPGQKIDQKIDTPTSKAPTKEELEAETLIREKKEEEFVLNQNRAGLKKEFARFQFRESISENRIIGRHNSDKFKSVIMIDLPSNVLILKQKELKEVLTEGGSTESKGEITPFGVMAPLFELIAVARDLYFISMSTRQGNEKGTKEETRIIPGTNGDTPLEGN